MKNIMHCSLPVEWIVIDNDSDIRTKQGLQQLKAFAESRDHSFTIVEEPENTGVARAWNKGLSLATRQYICVLNNDCILMPEWDIIATREIEKEVFAIFSPFILEPPMFAKLYGENEFFHSSQNWKYYLEKNKGRYRKGIFGGVVFIGKKKCFDEVGLFDDKYWLTMEDIDFLYRATLKNLAIGITGNMIGFHHVSATRKSMMVDETANQNHFAAKWSWNFSFEEGKFVNKMIRSFRKKLFKYFGLMSTVNQVLK